MAENQLQISPDTPYSREAFEWLMINAPGKSYLDDEILRSIDEALSKGDDEYLQGMYPIIHAEYLRASAIEADMEKQEEIAIENFKKEVEEIDRQIKKERKEMTEKVEKEEKAEAENILKDL